MHSNFNTATNDGKYAGYYQVARPLNRPQHLTACCLFSSSCYEPCGSVSVSLGHPWSPFPLRRARPGPCPHSLSQYGLEAHLPTNDGKYAGYYQVPALSILNPQSLNPPTLANQLQALNPDPQTLNPEP